MKIICSKCGNATDDVRGSLKHPFCSTCFKNIWNDDYDKYNDWIDSIHNPMKEEVEVKGIFAWSLRILNLILLWPVQLGLWILGIYLSVRTFQNHGIAWGFFVVFIAFVACSFAYLMFKDVVTESQKLIKRLSK